MPPTTKPLAGAVAGVTVPVDAAVPSPQLMLAVNSPMLPDVSASVKVATVPVNGASNDGAERVPVGRQRARRAP